MGTKTLSPTQITYVSRVKTVVVQEKQTRREQDDQSPWGSTTLTTLSTTWSGASEIHADDDYISPTTTKTTRWGSWTLLGDLKTRTRNKTETHTYRMALLQFDTAEIPEGATAYLQLYATEGGETNAYPDVYKINEEWDESTVKWSNKPEMSVVLSSQTLPLNAWASINVSGVLDGYGFALLDEDFGTGSNREKKLPKTGDYAPQLVVTFEGSSNVYVQTATGLQAGQVYVQTASDLVPGTVYVMTANGLKQSS